MNLGKGSLREEAFTISDLSPVSQFVNLPFILRLSLDVDSTSSPLNMRAQLMTPSSTERGMSITLI